MAYRSLAHTLVGKYVVWKYDTLSIVYLVSEVINDRGRGRFLKATEIGGDGVDRRLRTALIREATEEEVATAVARRISRPEPQGWTGNWTWSVR